MNTWLILFSMIFYAVIVTLSARKDLSNEPLTQALGQRAIPCAVALTRDGAGAQQVVAWVAAVRNCSLEAVAMRPAGKYLPDAVLHVTRLCAVYNWNKREEILYYPVIYSKLTRKNHQLYMQFFSLLNSICLSITFRICYFHPYSIHSSTPI